MSQDTLGKLFGVMATMLVSLFVLGLALSITTGASGFWGGLPFWVISIVVLMLVLFDFWDSCIRTKSSN
ncbi:MAG: hypothetical protein ACKVIK_07325 [Rhodospirillales bacterium]|jgi:hypothetical protein